MSSRTGDKDAIGHKGIGTKSYFLSNHGLIVVTKTKADADWACLQLANPMEWLLSATSTSQASAHLWMLNHVPCNYVGKAINLNSVSTKGGPMACSNSDGMPGIELMAGALPVRLFGR